MHEAALRAGRGPDGRPSPRGPRATSPRLARVIAVKRVCGASPKTAEALLNAARGGAAGRLRAGGGRRPRVERTAARGPAVTAKRPTTLVRSPVALARIKAGLRRERHQHATARRPLRGEPIAQHTGPRRPDAGQSEIPRGPETPARRPELLLFSLGGPFGSVPLEIQPKRGP